MKQKTIERMAMAAWAAHRGIGSDIQARWSALSEHDEGRHWRIVAAAVYNAEHKKHRADAPAINSRRIPTIAALSNS